MAVWRVHESTLQRSGRTHLLPQLEDRAQDGIAEAFIEFAKKEGLSFFC